jgi:trigger factor
VVTTLTIHKEEDEQRQLQLTVEVAEERVQKAMRQKARQLGREIRIPGFRPGKAPYNVIERRIGKNALRAETVEDMVDDIFTEVLKEVDVQPYAQPTMDEMALEPLRLNFTIPLMPQVELGDYRAIRREMPPVEITDEAVEDALEHVRNHHATVEPVDRPLEIGDLVTYSGTGRYVDGAGETQTFLNEERDEMLLDPEDHYLGAPFMENLVGMEAGDQKEFSLTYADDFEDEELAGREATFDLTVLDVQLRELPELDDELAQMEGDYETLDELRVALRERLEQQAADQARSDFFEAMVEDIWDEAEIVYPPVALEIELEEMIGSMRDQVTRIGWEWEDYLRLQGQTEPALREEWREQAEKRLERNLVLAHFVQAEQISLQDEHIEEALEERLAGYEDEEFRTQMRDYWLSEQGYPALSSELLMDLVVERMQAIAAGEAPDLAELEATLEAEAAADNLAVADDGADTDDEANTDDGVAADEEEIAGAEGETVDADSGATPAGEKAIVDAIFDPDDLNEVAEPAMLTESEE